MIQTLFGPRPTPTAPLHLHLVIHAAYQGTPAPTPSQLRRAAATGSVQALHASASSQLALVELAVAVPDGVDPVTHTLLAVAGYLINLEDVGGSATRPGPLDGGVQVASVHGHWAGSALIAALPLAGPDGEALRTLGLIPGLPQRPLPPRDDVCPEPVAVWGGSSICPECI